MTWTTVIILASAWLSLAVLLALGLARWFRWLRDESD